MFVIILFVIVLAVQAIAVTMPIISFVAVHKTRECVVVLHRLIECVVVTTHHFHLYCHLSKIYKISIDLTRALADNNFHATYFFFKCQFCTTSNALNCFLECCVYIKVFAHTKCFHAKAWHFFKSWCML